MKERDNGYDPYNNADQLRKRFDALDWDNLVNEHDANRELSREVEA
jgi:hypothetical protein